MKRASSPLKILIFTIFLNLVSGCAKTAGLFNFGGERSDRSTVDMKDIVAENVAAEMREITTELKQFTAETVKTTTQTFYGDAKWVVIVSLGFAILISLLWTVDRAASWWLKLLHSRRMTKIEGALNGGERPNIRAPPCGSEAKLGRERTIIPSAPRL